MDFLTLLQHVSQGHTFFKLTNSCSTDLWKRPASLNSPLLLSILQFNQPLNEPPKFNCTFQMIVLRLEVRHFSQLAHRWGKRVFWAVFLYLFYISSFQPPTSYLTFLLSSHVCVHFNQNFISLHYSSLSVPLDSEMSALRNWELREKEWFWRE